MTGPTLRAAVAASLLAAAGCGLAASSASLSGSVQSSSKVVSSPMESASESSKSSLGSPQSRYRDLVRDHTVEYVHSGGETDAFLGDLSELAERYSISDWEGSRDTWQGVGEGLARARVTGVELESYKTRLTGSDPVRMSWIDEGYERERQR